jgi:hypothetical protein
MNMESTTPAKKPLFTLVGLIVILALVVIGAKWRQAGKDNQFAPPPGAVDPPVVAELPRLLEFLGEQKAVIEGAAARAKRLKREGRLATGAEHEGRELYAAARLKANGTAQFIQDAMARRFRPEDAEAIADRLRDLSAATESLTAWRARVDRPTYGALPTDDLNKMVDDWLGAGSRVNEERIKFWHARLEAVKVVPWGEVPEEPN